MVCMLVIYRMQFTTAVFLLSRVGSFIAPIFVFCVFSTMYAALHAIGVIKRLILCSIRRAIVGNGT